MEFGHDTHLHPHVGEFSGVDQGEFVADFIEPDPDQFYRIILTVTDSNGASFTTFVDIQPLTVTLDLVSDPAGAPLTIDGQPVWRGAGAPRLFDPDLTPTTMGAVAEAARTFRATRRSRHPLVSVCANGARAEAIVRDHPLPFCEGAGGPFERLYELDAHTLLLGVGFDRCTSLHYAESLTPRRRTKLSRYPMSKDGELVWIEAPDMAADNGAHFPIVGRQFMETGEVRQGVIGQAPSLFFSTRALVDFAQQYFSRAL